MRSRKREKKSEREGGRKRNIECGKKKERGRCKWSLRGRLKE